MTNPSLVIVDNFLEQPDTIRTFALQQNFVANLNGYKGKRTAPFRDQSQKETFEKLLGRKIIKWSEYEVNGAFQICTAEDPVVYHCDKQTHAGIIFLTPDAPPEAGTSIWRSKKSKASKYRNDNDLFAGGFYDPTLWEKVDQIGNVYNRLILWEGSNVHSASCYFGQSLEDARLFQIFFFDVE